jgi:hypothetical protein
MLSHGGAGGE